MLRTLLDHGASPSLVLDDHGVTALHEAVRSQNRAAMALLLARGANLDVEDPDDDEDYLDDEDDDERS